MQNKTLLKYNSLIDFFKFLSHLKIHIAYIVDLDFKILLLRGSFDFLLLQIIALFS